MVLGGCRSFLLLVTKAFLKCNRDLEEYFLFLNERGKQRIMAIFLINGSNLENTRDYYVVKIFVDILKEPFEIMI